jgi:protein-disulfide isomerase
MPSRDSRGTLGTMSRKSIYILAFGGATVIAAALIGGTVLSTRDSSKPGSDAVTSAVTIQGAAAVNGLLAGIPQQGTMLGNAKAPVTLVEYADLQCPYCARVSTTEFPGIVRDYVRAGRVRVIFRGLSFVGPDSETALQTALSAGSQQRLWHVVQLLYANQGAENSGWVTEDLLRGVGKAVPGLDVGSMLGGRSAASVASQREEAQRSATTAGVTGTPTFAVGRTNGVLTLLGTNDAQTIRAALDAALAQ